MSSTSARWAAAALAAAVLTPSASRAEVIDLTTPGSSGSSQGAWFYQADPQPTGTGYIDPFVRIQRRGTERGYNTDGRPVEFDTKDQNHWTHSLPLNSLAAVTLDGKEYHQFLLDVNEQGNDKGRLLSMNDFRLYLGDAPDLTGWNDGFGSRSTKVYDIDAGAKGDTTVELDYKLNHGSGSGDMYAYVPTSLFQGHDAKFRYVYLYSAFGTPNGSDAGFEEWAALRGEGDEFTTSAVPAPPGVVLAGVCLGCVVLSRLRRRTAQA